MLFQRSDQMYKERSSEACKAQGCCPSGTQVRGSEIPRGATAKASPRNPRHSEEPDFAFWGNEHQQQTRQAKPDAAFTPPRPPPDPAFQNGHHQPSRSAPPTSRVPFPASSALRRDVTSGLRRARGRKCRCPRLPLLSLWLRWSTGPAADSRCAAAMGVPAFFRWLSRKYPSIIVDCVEEKVSRGQAAAAVEPEALASLGRSPRGSVAWPGAALWSSCHPASPAGRRCPTRGWSQAEGFGIPGNGARGAGAELGQNSLEGRSSPVRFSRHRKAPPTALFPPGTAHFGSL